MTVTPAPDRTNDRPAKAPYPHFYADPNIDRLMTMVMNLAAEVAVLRERLDTHEQVAAAKQLFTPADIEAYDPADDIRAARDAWRNRFLDRLLTVVQEDMEKAR
jgi:hypothetical protein